MKKKILFVIWSLGGGGAERSLVNLLNEMPEEQFDMDLLLVRHEGLYLNQVPSYVHIIDTPEDLALLYQNSKKINKQAFIRVIGTLISKLKEDSNNYKLYRWKHFYSKTIKSLNKEYDVAVAYVPGELMAFILEKVNANRKVCFVHTDYSSAMMAKKYELEYFSKIDAIATISDECVSSLIRTFPSLKSKVKCIHNINSPGMIIKKSLFFDPKEINGEFNILSIGRLVPLKQFNLAIEAASILKESGKCFRWYLIGEGPEKSLLTEMIKSSDLDNFFFLLGAKENPYPYLKKADVIVQTSKWEGKSVVLDEAKILKRPIIATNYPTVYDQVINNKEGLIVNMDAQSIAEAIVELMTNADKRIKIEKYLGSNDYGNQCELTKYISFFTGDKE